MRILKFSLLVFLSSTILFSGCASWNKTQKGAVVGTTAGGAAGAIIGKASGNTALGAIIGAAAGGAAGAVIGKQMDKQAEEIANSVPDAKVERVGEGIVVEFSSNILFGFDQSDLSEEAKSNLDKLIIVMNEYPDTDIEIQGHTDSKGSDKYNQTLSEKRAGTVAGFLTGKGIPYSRVTTKGFGESLPKYSNETAEGQALNRRVEFLISANEKMKAEAEESVN